MPLLRSGFHPIILTLIGVASGALALGASIQSIAKPIPTPTASSAATVPSVPERRFRWFPALFTPEAEASRRNLDLGDPFPREPTEIGRAHV